MQMYPVTLSFPCDALPHKLPFHPFFTTSLVSGKQETRVKSRSDLKSRISRNVQKLQSVQQKNLQSALCGTFSNSDITVR